SPFKTPTTQEQHAIFKNQLIDNACYLGHTDLQLGSTTLLGEHIMTVGINVIEEKVNNKKKETIYLGVTRFALGR
ncbi:unnamed protein product, partial [marine sediment metagenome]